MPYINMRSTFRNVPLLHFVPRFWYCGWNTQYYGKKVLSSYRSHGSVTSLPLEIMQNRPTNRQPDLMDLSEVTFPIKEKVLR